MGYEYTLVDVFTDAKFAGNQLAVFLDGDRVPGQLMQKIARELNLAETVFVLPPEGEGTARLRIFTPGAEVPFAGHPTVGTAAVLVVSGRIPADDPATRFTLEEGVGPIEVEVRRGGHGSTRARFRTAKLPEWGPAPEPEAAAAAVSLRPEDLAEPPDAVEAVSCGLPYVVVPVRDRETLARARPDPAAWDAHLADAWARQVYVITRDADPERADLRVRMFAPELGVVEDPATGSAAAAVAGYLEKRAPRAPDRLRWRIEQGIELGRPSLIEVEAERANGRLAAVYVGGEVVRIGRGVMEL